MENTNKGITVLVLGVIISIGLIYLLFVFAVPWGQLQAAHYHRRVQVVDAEGKRDAAVLLAEAEINRAKGVAGANQIIAESISEPYLRYLWVQTLQDHEKQVIYVPTEGMLPILESTRLLNPK